MGSRPSGKKRILKKKVGKARPDRRGLKDISERDGSFHLKGRREEMLDEDIIRKGGRGRPVQDVKRRLYGGAVTIQGKFSTGEKEDIVGIINKAAAGRGGAHPRGMSVEFKGQRIVVYTTEGQLAVAIGKRIHRARKGGKLTITWSDDDKPVIVHWSA